MSEWGIALIAAGAAVGGSGITGWFTSRVSRRQVGDQAQVEHGQWQRGQRQQVYLALMTAWDEMILQFGERILGNEELLRLNERQDLDWVEVENTTRVRLDNARAPLRRALDQVRLLGPADVSQAASTLLTTTDRLVEGVIAQYAGDDDPYGAWRDAREEGDRHREAFMAAAAVALDPAPGSKPGRP
ncbi:hypothetical protein [Streptomyces sp. NPDC046371]|uniref:hypothetical protein n=1 Tax=Streptomyces sp. NPDC046371 TaxID=3154916 RepID=UPI00340C3190